MWVYDEIQYLFVFTFFCSLSCFTSNIFYKFNTNIGHVYIGGTKHDSQIRHHRHFDLSIYYQNRCYCLKNTLAPAVTVKVTKKLSWIQILFYKSPLTKISLLFLNLNIFLTVVKGSMTLCLSDSGCQIILQTKNMSILGKIVEKMSSINVCLSFTYIHIPVGTPWKLQKIGTPVSKNWKSWREKIFYT